MFDISMQMFVSILTKCSFYLNEVFENYNRELLNFDKQLAHQQQ